MTSTTSSEAPAVAPLTPEQLIERFCHVGDVGDLAIPTLKDGVLTCEGFCGYLGGRGDSMAVGFDDGYDFLDYLAARGWRPLAEKREWPLTVYLSYRAEGQRAIATYIEGDLTISQFDCEERYREYYDSID
ncbi:MAG TPA: hypothetical protein VFN18_10975 [Solirubrobacterales bacterium]|nr:hypothetical protein [Solirubrobacterales bacterium]